METNEVKVLKDEIAGLEERIADKEQIIALMERAINDYKKELGIPMKPERTLRIV